MSDRSGTSRRPARRSRLNPLHLLAWVAGTTPAWQAVILLVCGLATLGFGMGLYHLLEGLPWADAFLNAAMLLGGMGPVDHVQSAAGKWWIGLYALFCGTVFLAAASLVIAHVIRAEAERG